MMISRQGSSIVHIMRIILFIAYLLACSVSCIGQTVYFSKKYIMFPDLHSVGFKVITMPDGYAFTTFEGASTQPKGSARVITDKQGNIIHVKQFLPNTNTINGLKYHPADSTFHFWGQYITSSSLNLYRPYIMKTNWWGDTIWATEFDYAGYNLCRNAIELPSGDFMALTTTSAPNLDTNVIGLIKVDAQGNELWHKGFKSPFFLDDSYGLYLRNDSTLMIGSNGSYLFYDTLAPPTDGYTILEVDFDGNLIRDTSYLTYSGVGHSTGWLSKIGNGDYVFVDKPPFFHMGDNYRLSCIDENYAIKWQKSSLSNGESAYAPSFTINNKGNVITGGRCTGFGDHYPYISEVDTGGDIVWERVARPPIMGQEFSYGSTFESIQQTDDGGYIAVGNFHHTNGQYQTWLIKLDSLGCIEPGCQTDMYLTVGTDEVPLAQDEAPGLFISPNPADESASIVANKGSGQLFITDPQGRPLSAVPISIDQSLTLNTQSWPSGTYSILYVGEKGEWLGLNKLLVIHRR
jgi:hypothetical protein